MNFPLPIRSISSTMEFSTPLFVDTNIVYQIDEAKFPGLKESSYEPALLVDHAISWNLSSTCAETTESFTSRTTCDHENQDLYSLIDSLDVEDSTLFPIVSGIDILDLPDIQLELPKYDRPISICDRNPGEIHVAAACDLLPVENVNISLLDSIFEKSTASVSSNTNNNQFDVIDTPSCTSGQKPSCQFTKTRTRSKRKRYMSSAFQEEVTNCDAIDEFVCLKKSKLNKQEPYLTRYSIEKCFDDVINDFYPQRTLSAEFDKILAYNFSGSPNKCLTYRQW